MTVKNWGISDLQDFKGMTGYASHTITQRFNPKTPGISLHLDSLMHGGPDSIDPYDFPNSDAISAACEASQGQSPDAWISAEPLGCSFDITTTGLTETGNYNVEVSDANSTFGNYPFTVSEGQVSGMVNHDIKTASEDGKLRFE